MKKIYLLNLFMAFIVHGAIGQTITGVFTQIPCDNDGIYTVTTTGLTLPITYTYYYGSSSVVHTSVNSATDQLTGFGMQNYGNIYCQATSSGLTVTIQDSYTPSFSFSMSSTSPICPATMGTVTATQSSGTPGPFTFSWTNMTTLVSYPGNNASVPEGFYYVDITDQITGCTTTITDSIGVFQQSNVTGTVSSTDANCTNGTATVVPSGGVAPYTYLWVNGATTPSISGLSQGNYGVTVTDAIGCQSYYLFANVQQNPLINVNTTITNATCVLSDGSAIAFGSGGANPYTYVWSNGQTGNTATALSGSTYYNVIATDANGCTGTSGAYITASTPITVTYTATPSQCTSATGSATLTATGGTAPYAYVWNTSPTASGLTLSGVTAGTYAFTVTDAVGCVRTGSVIVPSISTLNANVAGTSLACPITTGGIATAIASGSNPPFTYLWSNGATTNQITGLNLGGYSCVITDALGCSITKSTVINNYSPLSVSVLTSPATCLYAADGTATPTVIGGLAPYTYSYTNGTTASTATGLAVDDYWLTVTDANGCSKSTHFWITNANTSTSCYCTISGNVYVDANTNCTYDAGETDIENIMIHCSGIGYTFTDVNGYYSFQVPTGTYVISEQINGYYPLATCQSNSNSVSVVAAAGCNTIVDFASDINIIHDLKVVIINSFIPPVPGNNYQQKVIVKNMGTVTESGIQFGYEHDGQLSYSSSSSSSLVQLNSVGAPYAYSIQTGFPNLSPSVSDVMLLNYTTPTNIPIGTVVDFYDTVANLAPIDVNWLLDYSPWDNVNFYQTTVISSYDPNYKEVSPKGTGPEGYITTATTEFDYTIHFQNEGTYFAQNIYITDQLDADLDWTTLVPGYSDYDYTTTVSETGLVTFTFANINLPWKSQYGNALSSGLVSYSIKRKLSNPNGTEYTNTADIFFDFNPPITTNTTLNTMGDALAGIDEVNNEIGVNNSITVDMYPIPARDVITINVNNNTGNEAAILTIVDLMGNVVMTNNLELNEGSTAITQNISNLATGTYLTKIQFDNGSFIVKKIVLFNE